MAAIPLGRPLPAASSNQPGRRAWKQAWRERLSSLFGLAPGGVCRAVRIAASAVRSYRTLSPLPRAGSPRAVCFLWHFPWGRPRRTLSGTVLPWSPDFPPRAKLGAAARPADGGMWCQPGVAVKRCRSYPRDVLARGRLFRIGNGSSAKQNANVYNNKVRYELPLKVYVIYQTVIIYKILMIGGFT